MASLVQPFSWSQEEHRNAAIATAAPIDPNPLPTSHAHRSTANFSENVHLNSYHEQAATVWARGTIAIVLSVMLLSYLNIHIVWNFLALFVGLYVIGREVKGIRADFAWDIERRQAARVAGNVHKDEPESVEWLNEYIANLWPILDTQIFLAGTDLLEDALKSASPAIVKSVRVSKVHQGSNPIRLLGLRVLPSDTDITQVPSDPSHTPLPSITPIPTLVHLEKEEEGHYFNVECDFSYRRNPRTRASASSNPHFVLHLGVGVTKKARVDIPVFVALTGLHGKIRLRIQIIPEPPFARHVQFSLVTPPTIDISARPLRSINIMNLPGVSPFILASLNAIIVRFVAPFSYTIDLSRFFLGSDVVMTTRSVGIFTLLISKATKLTVRDKADHHPDPFVVVSFENSKSLYQTRTLEKDDDPIWEELAFIRVANDDENKFLRLTVMDYAKYEGDEPIGFLDIPLDTLQASPGVYQHLRGARLTCSHRGDSIESTISASIAFFPLARSVPPHAYPDAVDHDSDDMTTEREHRPTFADRSRPEEGVSAAYAQRMREMLDGRLPANALQRTGILSYQIHQATGLVSEILDGGKKDRHVVSSYCRVLLNDEKVFQTRIKSNSAAPYFNSGAENFTADWRTEKITVTVYDSREGEPDVIIGTLSLFVRELLEKNSQSTRWHSLNGGGGRLRLSLLFKPLAIIVPAPLREWNVGVLEISALAVQEMREQIVARLGMAIEGGSSFQLSESGTIRQPLEPKVNGTARRYEISYPIDELQPIRLAVCNRRVVPLVFKLSGITTLKRKNITAEGVIWLNSLGEGAYRYNVPLLRGTFDSRPYAPTTEEIPLPTMPTGTRRRHKQDRKARASPNNLLVSPPLTPQRGVYPANPSKPYQNTMGTVEMTALWIPGFALEHADIIADQPLDIQHAYEAFQFMRITHSENGATEATHLEALLGNFDEYDPASRRSSFSYATDLDRELGAIEVRKKASLKKESGFRGFMSTATRRINVTKSLKSISK